MNKACESIKEEIKKIELMLKIKKDQLYNLNKENEEIEFKKIISSLKWVVDSFFSICLDVSEETKHLSKAFFSLSEMQSISLHNYVNENYNCTIDEDKYLNLTFDSTNDLLFFIDDNNLKFSISPHLANDIVCRRYKEDELLKLAREEQKILCLIKQRTNNHYRNCNEEIP